MKWKKLTVYTVAAVVIFWACKKSHKNNDEVDSHYLISEARAWFNDNVLTGNLSFHGTTDERQKIKKTPVWEKAYTAESNENVVCIPLDYERNIHFTSYESGAKMSLNNQSRLVVSKKNGQFKAEVITLIPDMNFLTGSPAKFQGSSLSKIGQVTQLQINQAMAYPKLSRQERGVALR